MEAGFSVDLISDLNVTNCESFDWTGKPTSLFCIIAGNISDDLGTIKFVLDHLGTLYRGIFYIDGSLEHLCLENFNDTIKKIGEICQGIPNAVFMHNHVVVLNGIAFVAINGWYKNGANIQNFEDSEICFNLQKDDLAYLTQTLKNLQNHKEIGKVIVISNSIPSEYLNYIKDHNSNMIVYEPGFALITDNGAKVTHWLYSGTEIVNDCVLNNRRYVNNPRVPNQPYWPKRIML